MFGTVEVGWFDRRALSRGIPANRDYGLRRHTQNGRHGSLACGDCLLHQLPAAANRAGGGGKFNGSRGDVGGVFAQRVPGQIVRSDSGLSQHPKRRDRNRKDRRLGKLGQPKLLFGPFKAKLCQVEAKRFVGFFECPARDGES